jgi:Icc-related predicted phosphoesterase
MKENTYEQLEVDDNIKLKNSNSSNKIYYIIICVLSIIICCLSYLLLKNNPPTSNGNELKFLLVSDIHDNTTSIDILLEKNKNKKYNYILYAGDMVKMTPGQQNSSEHAHEYEERMTDYINKLEKIAPIIYIPGNNEPYTIYENNSPQLSKTSVNVHNNYLKIKDDLYIIGLGGCVPILNGGKYDKNVIPFETLNTSNVIQNGYPYNLPDYGLDNYKKSDEWYGNDIKKIINNIKKEAGNNKYQTILLSHNGPLYSWTNAQQQLGTGEHLLYLGSMELEKILINDENLFLDIHGHIHPSRGIVTMIPDKTVINPGAMINGFYGELTLTKKNDKWTVDSINLLNL